MERLPLLVLVRNITRTLSYYDDWRDALRAHPAFQVDIEDIEGATVRNITHGINPDAFHPGPALNERPIDIGARSDRYNIYVGDDQRVALHDLFEAKTRQRGLRADIVLGGERFDRRGWAAFLGSSKATIATEAGSDFLDRDDRLSEEVTALLRERRGGLVIRHESLPRKLSRRLLPRSARHWVAKRLANSMVEDVHLHQNVDDDVIEAVRHQVFRPERKAPFPTKVISSRHFDAAACKTLQILTPGRYNDMLEAGRHFIELDSDFSNIGDVLDQLDDLSFCQKMVDEAFDDLMANHTYAHRMADLESALRSL